MKHSHILVVLSFFTIIDFNDSERVMSALLPIETVVGSLRDWVGVSCTKFSLVTHC